MELFFFILWTLYYTTNQELNNAKDAYHESIGETEAAAIVAEKYADRLEELESQGRLTAKEQEEYNGLILKLKTIMPDLALDIDKETGLLADGAKAIKRQIIQWKEKMKLQAIESLMTETLTKQVKLQFEAIRAQENYNKKRAAYYELEKKIADGEIDLASAAGVAAMYTEYGVRNLDELFEQMMVAEGAMESANDALRESSDEVDQLAEAYQEAADGVGLLSEAAEESADPIDKSTDAIKELEQALADAGAEADELAKDHLSKVIGAAQNMFEEIDTGSRTSMQELIGTLIHNKQVIDDWESNLTRIYERGASEEFVKYLESLGLSYADQVDMIANSTDEEFADLAHQWEQNSADAYSHGEHYGEMLMQGVIDGINRRISELESVGAAAGRAIERAFANVLEIHSPSKVFKRDADFSVDGYVDEFENRIPEMASVSERSGRAIISAFDPSLNINTGMLDRSLYSPSQAFPAQMGADIGSLGGKLDALLDAVRAGHVLALDGDKLVGGTIDRINAELGNELILSERSAI